MSYQSINPATGETLQTFEETTDQELESALETAADCFEGWRAMIFSERAAIANKASEILLSRIDEFAEPMTLERPRLNWAAATPLSCWKTLISRAPSNGRCGRK
jgi:succinate-semialdehyde dehydrogenase / glutarate-semialdehyde dehydrogenase